MEKKYFGIPIDETALGKNDGCKEAPNFLFDLFKVKGEIFSLKGEIEDKHQQIYEKAKEIFKEVGTSTPVFFGGTHDITGFVFKVFAEKNENAKLLIFDAHADCEDALSITTHEDFVRMIVEKNIVKVENILIVGLRHLSGIEKDFLKDCVSMLKQMLDEYKPEYFLDCYKITKDVGKKADYKSVQEYAIKKTKEKYKL